MQFFLDCVITHKIMYCLQCLLPLMLIPKPTNPASMQTHTAFVVLYLISYILEKKPCSICVILFLATVFLTCYNGFGSCLLWSNCNGHLCENG